MGQAYDPTDPRHQGKQSVQPQAFRKVETSQVDAPDRLDFWRQLFVSSHVDTAERRHEKDFNGRLITSQAVDKAFFSSLHSDPVVCRFGERESELVLVGFVGAGTVQIAHGNDERTHLDSGSQMLVVDCDKRALVCPENYELTYLGLPRALVKSAMGEDPTERNTSIRHLQRGGMSEVLYRHLSALSTYGGTLNEIEASAAVKAATDMAIALLSGFRLSRSGYRERMENALVASARTYVDRHFAQPDLTSDAIAAALGCSRAHLYRAFAQQEETIVAYLRKVRLRHAALLLRSRHDHDIGLIAFDCGYFDLSAFGKAFKRHFGVNPSSYRSLATSGHPGNLPG
ncbi:helix-turn-helix transcriptional regulator [Xanthobacteraceae bacterium A53D]